MRIDPITFILFLVMFLPILKGFLVSYRSKDQKSTINSLLSSISLILSIFIGIGVFKEIFLNRNSFFYDIIQKFFKENLAKFIDKNPVILYLAIFPMLILIIYIILKWFAIGVCSIVLYPIFDVIESFAKKRSSVFRRTLGAIFQIPRAIIYLIVVCFILNGFSAFNVFSSKMDINPYLQKSKFYKELSIKVVLPISKSQIAKKLPNIVSNSFKIEIAKNKSSDYKNNNSRKVIIYYNGITLDEAIKSNGDIDDFSRKIAANKKESYKKSYEIYRWISKNISYDYDKAKRILNNDFSKKSGAINTFNTKKGICFDYSSLFVAMCRANNIKVRMVTGMGFDGRTWVSHSWNQFYDEDKNTWVNVDTTFGVAGDYFNSRRFLLDHKEDKIAGEWK